MRRLGGRTAALAAAGMIVVAGVAYAGASTLNGSDVIRGCVAPSGDLKIVDGGRCKKNEDALSWNQQGPAGPQGPAGARGETGAQGSAGAKGDTGPQGPSGPKGDAGVQGATGPQGPAGPKGDAGVQGPAGPAGPTGETGETGPSDVYVALGKSANVPSSGTPAASGHLDLSAGQYLIEAQAFVDVQSTTQSGYRVSCQLYVGGQSVTTSLETVTSSWGSTIPMEYIASVGASTSVEVQCAMVSSTRDGILRANVFATKVGSLHVQQQP
jgi:hypothetical protein